MKGKLLQSFFIQYGGYLLPLVCWHSGVLVWRLSPGSSPTCLIKYLQIYLLYNAGVELLSEKQNRYLQNVVQLMLLSNITITIFCYSLLSKAMWSLMFNYRHAHEVKSAGLIIGICG